VLARGGQILVSNATAGIVEEAGLERGHEEVCAIERPQESP
jgi:hypothetical protein